MCGFIKIVLKIGGALLLIATSAAFVYGYIHAKGKYPMKEIFGR